MKKLIITTSLLLLLGVNQAQAYTVFCSNCSNNLVQMFERITSLSQLETMYNDYAQSIQQTAQQIEMVRQNVEQYANMLQNTEKLPQQLLSQISGDLRRLSSITSEIYTIRADVGALEEVHEAVYMTQSDFKELASTDQADLSVRNQTIRENLDEMSKRVDEATLATFQASGAQLKDLENSGELEDYINNLLSTPSGQMQALMSANQLTALQIQEARQLRELVATKAQSDIASQVKEEKQEQMSEELVRNLMKSHNFDYTSQKDPF